MYVITGHCSEPIQPYSFYLFFYFWFTCRLQAFFNSFECNLFQKCGWNTRKNEKKKTNKINKKCFFFSGKRNNSTTVTKTINVRAYTMKLKIWSISKMWHDWKFRSVLFGCALECKDFGEKKREKKKKKKKNEIEMLYECSTQTATTNSN